ncbi:putative Carboxymuconolactone decarboxylase [Legionella birminghamensis]|uniref:Carboxymuconolactone decarboxylase n=1 Tax=Legionella birminghamensis TaxID=28083 RepID=A0A378IA87_9GAMM|nr:carboxymuconolactone decarboxylase family protein [Legionella birminghamensis]KTC75973.1 putative Carboxymuconolactone decarboxylase [Legionella birminghamensis]STX32099.1 putative Carboxymuconolactone decarboxylase [Legionella birminghamensis]
MTTSRADFYKASPEALKAMMGLERFVNECGLDKGLIHLIKLRVSQINGCAFCVDMHSAEALGGGETQRRLNTVVVWREVPFFTEPERVALAWAEAITLLSETHAPDDVYEELLKHFSEKQAVDLTLAIITINGWNRLAVGFRKLPG